MGDNFRTGDIAARALRVPRRLHAGGGPVVRAPPIGLPILVTATHRLERDCHREYQLIRLLGWPVPRNGWWNAAYFRKVLPDDLRSEPIRAPSELEPA